MQSETLKVIPGNYQLADYDEAVKQFNWQDAEAAFSWASTGKVNMAYECIDRHAESERQDKIALIYQDEGRSENYSYLDLKKASNRAANVFTEVGIEKGDRVFLFMPRIPELYFATFGLLKIGAIVGPLFEAFMEAAVRDRLADSEAVAIVTTAALVDRIPFQDLPYLKHVLIVGDCEVVAETQIDFLKSLSLASDQFEIAWLDRSDGMIIHYTSGSTGKPKGVLHAHNAMIQHYQTGKWVLDLREDDIYWCTADPGWVTGTSYGMFAPWLNGATSLVVGGRFTANGWYQMIETHQVTVWYSAPTVFRMLMSVGETVVSQYDLSSLRHVLSVGEPLNPEVIKWGLEVYGHRIHDTWWMTETGAQLICNYPAMEIRPGSMGKPLPGIEATIIDDDGNLVAPYVMGNLAIKKGWPSMMKAIWNNEAKYQSYFVNDTWYVSGDSAYQDVDGYFWFQGRIDDVIMTAGERVGPFEVESKLIEHPAVAEAGVIGKPDPIRGEIIKAFIALRQGFEPSEELKTDIATFIKHNLAAHAYPREIAFVPKLPKTRSGKIMRRVLKATELGLPTGDLSTIEE